VQRFRGAGPPVSDLISINQTIRATSRLLAHRLGSDIALTLELAEPDGQARIEPAQLDRVLLNLIANARHAMPAGGAVTLRTGLRTVTAADRHVPDTIPTGDYVMIAVADTGGGIPLNQLSRMFEPGVSSRHGAGGSGLGLSSVRDIVRQSSGFIAVASGPEGGTCFEIYLPRLNDPARPAPDVEPRALAGGRIVLVVDDDPLVRQVAERILLRAGWRVLCADGAEAALAILENTVCDLMISDVAMPGMDGLALGRLVRARVPDFPVILASGYARAESDDGLSGAHVGFLEKPYDPADLLEVVARVAPSHAGVRE
jgi:two-component system cell cycle sensor histidine kinase/response regulator CckA